MCTSSYAETLEALRDADDESDRCRGELALAILLLTRNYTLDPPTLYHLLDFRGQPGLGERARQAWRSLAEAHLSATVAGIAPSPRAGERRTDLLWS